MGKLFRLGKFSKYEIILFQNFIENVIKIWFIIMETIQLSGNAILFSKSHNSLIKKTSIGLFGMVYNVIFNSRKSRRCSLVVLFFNPI